MSLQKPSRFDGDPKMYIDEDGMFFDFRGGQPVMDGGLENYVMISLFTDESWWGNILLEDDEQIGSRFESTAKGPITLSSINDTEQEAEKALSSLVDSGLAKSVDIDLTNPSNRAYSGTVTITAPTNDVLELQVTKNGQSWINQFVDPANRK